MLELKSAGRLSSRSWVAYPCPDGDRNHFIIQKCDRQDHTVADFAADFYLAVLAESPKCGLGVEMRVAFGTRPFISSFSFWLRWGQKM